MIAKTYSVSGRGDVRTETDDCGEWLLISTPKKLRRLRAAPGESND